MVYPAQIQAQIEAGKVAEMVANQAKGWPIMVVVTLVIAIGALWFFYWYSERRTKQLVAQMERQHAEVVEILKRELYESRKMYNDLTESIISMNYKT